MTVPCFALAAACALATLAAASAASAQSEQASGSEDSEREDSGKDAVTLLGAQAFWVQGKVMPGAALGLRLGSVELDFEASLLWLTEPAPPRGLSFLGTQLGAHLMFLPVHERYFDVGVGLGGDFYWLWNVHGDALEPALTLQAAGNFWITPQLAIHASARAYPLKSSGLELGTTRTGDAGPPVLFSTGVTWRL